MKTLKTLAKLTTMTAALLLFTILVACGGDSQESEGPAARSTASPTGEPAPTDSQPSQEQAPATRSSQTQRPAPTSAPSPAATPAAAGQPTLTPAPASTATPVPMAPTPETGGICSRHPSVQRAILSALDANSCSQVTDSDLSSITSLDGISVERLPRSETAGLTGLTHLSVTVASFDYDFGNLESLDNLDLSIILPPQPLLPAAPSGYKLRIQNTGYNPHPFGVGMDSSPLPPGIDPYQGESQLQHLKVTLDLGHEDNAILPGITLFLGVDYPAENLHIINRSHDALSSFNINHHLRSYPWHPRTSVTIELDPSPRYDIPAYADTSGDSNHPFFGFTHRSQTFPRTLTILNRTASPIRFRGGFFSLPEWTANVEIRGPIEISGDAFHDLSTISTLHLDPDQYGEPHILWTTDPAPTGSGFVVHSP